MRPQMWLVFVCLGSLAASTARASVIWNGTFGSGSTAQWTELQEVNPNRLTIVPNPAGGSGSVLKAEVFQGDNPIPGASGNRAELDYKGNQPQEGDERYYAWSVFWPSSYASAETWQLFTQWHQTGADGSPPVQFFTWGSSVELEVSQAEVWKAPLVLDQWHTFVFHVKWSSAPATGFVELYYDGKLSLSKTYGATLFEGQGVYIKQGLYRNADIAQEQTVYHSGMVEGDSLDDVWPQQTSTGTGPIAILPSPAPVGPTLSPGPATTQVAPDAAQTGCTTANGGWALAAAALLGGASRRQRSFRRAV